MTIFLEKDFKDRLTILINRHFDSEDKLIELSKKLKVTRSTINRWRNQSLTPKVEMLVQFAIIINVSLDYIVFGNTSNIENIEYNFNQEKYINNIINIINTHFKNNLDASRKLNISDLTIRMWKQNKSTPNIFSITKLSTMLNISLDSILFG